MSNKTTHKHLDLLYKRLAWRLKINMIKPKWIKETSTYLFVSFKPIYACAISPLSFIFCTSSKSIVESVIVFWRGKRHISTLSVNSKALNLIQHFSFLQNRGFMCSTTPLPHQSVCPSPGTTTESGAQAVKRKRHLQSLSWESLTLYYKDGVILE